MQVPADRGHPIMTAANASPIVRAVALTLAAWLLSALVFSQTWRSMIDLWLASETFTHGFIILPISLWLIWRRRFALLAQPTAPWWPAIVPILLAGLGWAVGELADANVIRQLAAVAMLPLLALLILGWRAALTIWVPLAFLFFMVPVGEFLQPMMMEHTADFTVAALRATGIPVYREGLFFVVPSGQWSVVEACSGLRYLIASVVLGIIFAYITYRSAIKRLLFVVAAFVVPIVANWVRAYLIVMIGHLSSNRLAAGADHLIYGWVFFGIVIGLMFWIGIRWADDDPLGEREEARRPAPRQARSVAGAQIAAMVIGIACAVVWRPGVSGLLDATQPVSIASAFAPIMEPNTGPAPLTPEFSHQRETVSGVIRGSNPPVDAWVAYYARQHENAEMIAYGNVIVRNDDKIWRIARSSTSTAAGIEVRETELFSGPVRRLVWSWYVVDGKPFTSDTRAKLQTVAALLSGRGDHSAFAAISVPLDGNLDGARAALSAAARSLDPALRSAVREPSGRGG